MFRQAAGEDTVNISVLIGGDFQKHHNRYYCAKAQSLTGHPAISIYCGMSDGLLVGLMLVAGKSKKFTIYATVSEFEQAEGWNSAVPRKS